MDLMNVHTKFEVRSLTRSWDNNGYLKTLGNPWIRPRFLFSKFLMGFCSDGPYACSMYRPNLKSAAFPVPEKIAILDVWVVVLRTPNLGEEEAVWGRGWNRSKERWWIPIGSIVIFPLSSRASEILPLLCFGTPLFPTPPLHRVRKKRSHSILHVWHNFDKFKRNFVIFGMNHPDTSVY